jgi:hypothetical protein
MNTKKIGNDMVWASIEAERLLYLLQLAPNTSTLSLSA